jgi:hypothetical protein
VTTAEYQAGVERLAGARAALQVYEELALGLAAFSGVGKDRGLLICVKEQISATRLLVLEVGERCKPLGPDPGKRGGWGG